jgi:hypothetical protein
MIGGFTTVSRNEVPVLVTDKLLRWVHGVENAASPAIRLRNTL